MVQHYVSPVYVYKYPFEKVMAAYIRRFPRTEHIPILADTEVVEEDISEDGLVIRTKRLCKLVVEAPYLIKRIAGVDYCYFYQENILNWKERTLHISVYNETFSSRVHVKETCLYFVHGENESWTCYDQEATIEFVNFFGFEAQCERLALEKYTQQISKAKGVMDKFMQDLIASGDVIPNPYADYKLKLQQQEQQAQQEERPCTSPDVRRRKSTDSCALDNVNNGTICSTGTTNTSSSTTISGTTTSTTAAVSNSCAQCGGGKPASVHGENAWSQSTCSACTTFSTSGDPGTPPSRRLMHRHSKSLDTAKLNAEYIQRFLGELTPIQESNLIQLRSLISGSRFADKMPNDAVLLRFLRAREFNIEKARDMISHHLGWRKQYQVDQIIQKWEQAEVLHLYFPGGWHYSDKDGHPVFLFRLGQLDVKGLFESVGETTITKQLLVFAEEGLKRCEAATKSCEKAIGTVTLVCDLEGLSMRHFWRPGLNCFDRLLQLFQNNYPETMGKLLFVRAPRIFPLLWALVFPFIDEHTREKVFVSAGNDYLDTEEGLSNFLPQEYIPDFLGGTCKCSFGDGGMVPKKYFAEGPFSVDSQKSCALETLYTTVELNSSHIYEVLVEASSQSVIMWDFDVVRGPVSFSILHLADKPVNACSSRPKSTDSNGLDGQSSEPVVEPTTRSRHNSSDSCSSIIGVHRAGRVLPFHPSVEIREDELKMAKVVVPVQAYHETENVQNTLAISSHCGRYLLRWEVSESTASFSAPVSETSLEVSLSTTGISSSSGSVFRFPNQRRATIMYYCEVIPSANVKKASDSLTISSQKRAKWSESAYKNSSQASSSSADDILSVSSATAS